MGYLKKNRKVEVKLKCSDVEKSSDILLLSGKNRNAKLHTVSTLKPGNKAWTFKIK